MDNITLQLNLLRCGDQQTRIKVCEELEAAANLPPEAMTDLEQACCDADLVVAWAACRALFAHRKYEVQPNSMPAISYTVPIQKKRSWLFFPILVVAFFIFVGVFGLPVDLRCERVKPRGPVNCIKQSSLFGSIPLTEQEIADVRGARVGESDDYEGDVGYRVELLTADGMVPLRSTYISDFSGRAVKVKLADQVNVFAQEVSPGTLILTEPGLVGPDIIISFLIWLLLTVVSYAARYVWQMIRNAWHGM